MRKVLLISSAVAAVPLAVAVGPYVGELRGSLGVEAEWSIDGDFYNDGVAAIADLALLGPDYAGEAGTLAIRRASYEDVRDQPRYGARAELAYGVDDNVEVYGAFTWRGAGESVVPFGDIVIASTGQAIPLTARFEERDAYGVEFGARYYFDTGSGQVRPFVGTSVGAEYVEALRLQMLAPGAGVDIADLRFHDSTTLMTVGAEAGIAFGDGVSWAGALSVGLKYRSALNYDDSDLDSYGLGAITEDGYQIVVPVRGSLSVSF